MSFSSGPVRTQQPVNNANQRSPFGHMPAAPAPQRAAVQAAPVTQPRMAQQSAPRAAQAPASTTPMKTSAPGQAQVSTPVAFSAQEVAEFQPLFQKFSRLQINVEQILASLGGSMERLNRFRGYLYSQVSAMTPEENKFFSPLFIKFKLKQLDIPSVAAACGSKVKFDRFKEVLPLLNEAYEIAILREEIARLNIEKQQQQMRVDQLGREAAEHGQRAQQHSQRAEQHGQRAEQHGLRSDQYGREAAEHARQADEHARRAQWHDEQIGLHRANINSLTMYQNELIRQNQQAEQAIVDSRNAAIQFALHGTRSNKR